jgi:hypothetical protein
VLLHKRVHFVYVVVDDDVQALFDGRVLGDLLGCEGFGHCVWGRVGSGIGGWDRVRVVSMKKWSCNR